MTRKYASPSPPRYPHPAKSLNPSLKKGNPRPTKNRIYAEDEVKIRYFNGEYECKVCKVISVGRLQFEEHLGEQRHREAAEKAKKNQEGIYCSHCNKYSLQRHYFCQPCSVHSGSKVDFDSHCAGKAHLIKTGQRSPVRRENQMETEGETKPLIFCKTCKKSFPQDHYHCDVCQIFCIGPIPFKAHLQGSKHKRNVARERSKSRSLSGERDNNEEFVEEVDPDPVPVQQQQQRVQDRPGRFLCHACDERFATDAGLRQHARDLHGYLIKCTECVSLNHLPPAEVLTYTDLVHHYETCHAKKIMEHELKFWGELKTKHFGFIQCTICKGNGKNSIGDEGFWFSSDVDKEMTKKIREHFRMHHSSFISQAQESTVLGCQICSVRFGGSRNCRKWKDHLSTHEKASKDKTRSAAPGSSHGVTEPCYYCGEKVISSGDALQNHIQDHHLDLTFSCRLCIPGERYFYNSLEDVIKHLSLKHYGTKERKDVLMPGTKKNLLPYCWVSCKTCGYKGMGLGKESIMHQRRRHNGEDMTNYNIFCRLCAKDETYYDFFDTGEEFEEHMIQEHKDIVRLLPDK